MLKPKRLMPALLAVTALPLYSAELLTEQIIVTANRVQESALTLPLAWSSIDDEALALINWFDAKKTEMDNEKFLKEIDIALDLPDRPGNHIWKEKDYLNQKMGNG